MKVWKCKYVKKMYFYIIFVREWKASVVNNMQMKREVCRVQIELLSYDNIYIYTSISK